MGLLIKVDARSGDERSGGYIILRENVAISSSPGLYAIRPFDGAYLNYRSFGMETIMRVIVARYVP
jgi:hypothetical protein